MAPRRSKRRCVSNKRSPNSVVVVDLTNDEDERNEELDNVRKRLKTASPENLNVAVKPPVKQETPPPVFVHHCDVEEVGNPNQAVAVKPPVKQETPPPVVVHHCDVEEVGNPNQAVAVKSQVKQETPPPVVVDHCDVEEVGNPNQAVAVTPEADGDVAVVGVANEVRLPHARHDCTTHKFINDLSRIFKTPTLMTEADAQGIECNPKFCDLCYCYVCDKPVKFCRRWNTSDGFAHCLASSNGIEAATWKKSREVMKHFQPGSVDPERTAEELERMKKFEKIYHLQLPGESPYAPETPLAKYSCGLTKCHYCGWFSRLSSDIRDLRSAYCHCCGRIAKKEHTHPATKEYEKLPGDVLLGIKTIPFTLYTRYPQEMKTFQKYWKQYEDSTDGWTYKVADMEQDLFDHRFGSTPSIDAVCESIPISSAQPEDVTNGESVIELDFVELKDRNHVTIFEYLRKFASRDNARDGAPIFFNIRAEWKKPDDVHDNGKGRFYVEVFFRHSRFGAKTKDSRYSLAKFLGAWYGIFPFPLASLSCGIAVKDEVANLVSNKAKLAVAPFYISPADEETKRNEIADVKKQCLKEYNAAATGIRKNLALTSSATGNKEYVGGYTESQSDLQGVLKNYFREMLMEDIVRASRSNKLISYSWIGRACKVTSFHRSMRCSSDSHATVVPRSMEAEFDYLGRRQSFDDQYSDSLEPYLSLEDISIATEHLGSEAADLCQNMTSLNALVQHMESLGHRRCDDVRGLKVELLDFQKQAVCWMLEREQTLGGLESLLWAKLPNIEEVGKTLYYNPILDCISDQKPKLIRGGSLCSQMGLGKTIMTLALILKNPAPQMPPSGSHSIILDRQIRRSTDQGWSDDKKTDYLNPKRGSILSRGTLVICPVSLVGQWINEARSKLDDPGLVYPYHGQNRKRDASTLSKNSIVVTTYAVLSSDAYYHADKSNDDDYCPPLEQVRWWRVICDESHVMRTGTTHQTEAAGRLIAENKWCVTGTPVNTNMNDLKMQLKFVGLSHVNDYFSVFNATTFARIHGGKQNKDQSEDFRQFGHFSFLMRNVVLRHAMKQQYRKSSTDLMQLPPKTERKVEVAFCLEELAQYKKMEANAKLFYRAFKETNGYELNKHYLKLTSKLIPLRVACSGGCVPLDGADLDEEGADKEKSANQKPRSKVRYGDFAFTSKFKALIAELKRIRDEEPDSKSLVFSQYSSSLQWLQKELPNHGFTWVTLTGSMTMPQRSKALQDFQTSPPTKIFLLSMRAGAVGINLTQANRVFLLEPAMNPALEAQAIGRIHRLGQLRNVEIIRLVMKKSIESRIRRFLKDKYSDKSNTPAIVGNLKSDKNMLMTDEFDLLYGVQEKKGPNFALALEAMIEDGVPPAPDSATSGHI